MNQLTIDGDEYVYLIEQAKDGSYWAYFPDLPGCTSAAETEEELAGMAAEALGIYLRYYRDRNEPPPPRTHVGAGVAGVANEAAMRPEAELAAGANGR